MGQRRSLPFTPENRITPLRRLRGVARCQKAGALGVTPHADWNLIFIGTRQLSEFILVIVGLQVSGFALRRSVAGLGAGHLAVARVLDRRR